MSRTDVVDAASSETVVNGTVNGIDSLIDQGVHFGAIVDHARPAVDRRPRRRRRERRSGHRGGAVRTMDPELPRVDDELPIGASRPLTAAEVLADLPVRLTTLDGQIVHHDAG
jgi:hypothetical protein